MVSAMRIVKAIVQFVIVALPSLFILLWTLDAALVPGADVFIITAVQTLFIAIFIVYIYWRW